MPNLFENLDKLAAIGGNDIADKILVYGDKENRNRTKYAFWRWRGSGNS
ncbi:hypothetical protein [uncultured Arcticibacterium sp.]